MKHAGLEQNMRGEENVRMLFCNHGGCSWKHSACMYALIRILPKLNVHCNVLHFESVIAVKQSSGITLYIYLFRTAGFKPAVSVFWPLGGDRQTMNGTLTYHLFITYTEAKLSLSCVVVRLVKAIYFINLLIMRRFQGILCLIYLCGHSPGLSNIFFPFDVYCCAPNNLQS